jgi:signal transduction histidine kinase
MTVRDWPIARKFQVAALAIALTAVGVVSVSVIYTELRSVRSARLANARAIVRMVAENSATALFFDDRQVALQILSGVKAQPSTEAVALYDAKGQPYVWFPTNLPPTELPPADALRETNFRWDKLELSADVNHKGQHAGFVYLRQDLKNMRTRFRVYVLTVIAVSIGTVLLALLISKLLQRWIVAPVLSLSRMAEAVARDGDLSLRAEKQGNDEVGRLVERFNQMLADIQRTQQRAEQELKERRIAEEALRKSQEQLQAAQTQLQKHATHLENTVADRTARLTETVGELEAFSYSIAHDMRAPLRSMRGFSTLLCHDYGDKFDDTARDYLRRIDTSAARLDALITDVLNYSKVVRADLKLELVDTEKLVTEITESYPNLQPPNAQIVIHAPLPQLLANPAALTQVISNLLGNAVKFVPPGVKPRVVVRGETRGELARLWFEDNGIGISPQGQAKLFQMFQRLNRTEAYEGTGIGLAIVRKAIERMGGRAGVESEPGHGSRFWIELKGS